MFDNHGNFIYSTVSVAPTPATSGTSLTVADGSLFQINANYTVWPINELPLSNNAEIVRVTNRVGNVLTITRTQEGSTARTIVVGDQIAETITAKVITDIESATDLAATIHAATAKTTPADADELGIADSAASYALKKVSLLNAWLNYFKTKADSIYAAITHTHTPTEDTLQNLLNSSPASPTLAWTTDTKEKIFWDGTNWYRPAMPDIAESATPDMGVLPHGDRSGYTQTTIDGKTLSHIRIGNAHDSSQGTPTAAVVWAENSLLKANFGGSDQVIVSGQTLSWRTTQSGRRVLCALDESGNHWIDLSTSNSIDVGANGVPMMQGGIVDIGANPIARPLAGGRF
jgi:hypothetical protein